MVLDRFGRPLLNLRISIIDSCNLECFFCHKEGHYLSYNYMSPEEIKKIVSVAIKFGIKNIKITGGEPLLRDDLETIIINLKSFKSITEISMVTNGRLLSLDRAKLLKKNGLTRVNIGLPSINPSTYLKITGGIFEEAVQGIKNAVRADLKPVKLNMVLMKGLNDHEVLDALNFTRRVGAVLQIIELEPLNMDEATYRRFHVPLNDVEKMLKTSAHSIRVRSRMQARKVYSLPGVDVELVAPIDNTKFCAHCTRIRITSDGKIKPCLMKNNNLIDLLTPIRNHMKEKDLERIFQNAIELREPYCKDRSIN